MAKRVALDRLKVVLRYNSETGEFFWNISRGRNAKAGSRAGHAAANGYAIICVDGVNYGAHRLAWFFVHGRWPSEIDHIDGCKCNNKIDNLRDVTRSQNCINRKKKSTNRSGIVGVAYHKTANKWCAFITIKRKQRHLGYFETVQEAKLARRIAELKYFKGYGNALGA